MSDGFLGLICVGTFGAMVGALVFFARRQGTRVLGRQAHVVGSAEKVRGSIQGPDFEWVNSRIVKVGECRIDVAIGEHSIAASADMGLWYGAGLRARGSSVTTELRARGWF